MFTFVAFFAFFCQLPGCMFNYSRTTMNSVLFFLPFLQNLDVRRKKIFLGSIKLGDVHLCRNFSANKRPSQFLHFLHCLPIIQMPVLLFPSNYEFDCILLRERSQTRRGQAVQNDGFIKYILTLSILSTFLRQNC